MGLSHHWKRTTEFAAEKFAAAASDCRTMLGDTENLAGFDGSGPPIFSSDRIVFNGRTGQSCEPFEVSVVEFDRRGRLEFFSFCKTEFQPYDFQVKVALIVLEHHLRPQFQVTSDVDDCDWESARQAVQDRLGYGKDFSLAKL